MNTTRDFATISVQPRVWLVGGIGMTPDPVDLPTVRDNRMRTWSAGDDGRYHSTDGWHHATWSELLATFDLVEVQPASPGFNAVVTFQRTTRIPG